MTAEPLKVLLIEDDEDDFLLARGLLSEVGGRKVDLRWAASYQEALRAIESGGHDVCLVDYRLGERTGLELLREAGCADYKAPMIILTSQNDYDLDAEAMRAGAADKRGGRNRSVRFRDLPERAGQTKIARSTS